MMDQYEIITKEELDKCKSVEVETDEEKRRGEKALTKKYEEYYLLKDDSSEPPLFIMKNFMKIKRTPPDATELWQCEYYWLSWIAKEPSLSLEDKILLVELREKLKKAKSDDDKSKYTREILYIQNKNTLILSNIHSFLGGCSRDEGGSGYLAGSAFLSEKTDELFATKPKSDMYDANKIKQAWNEKKNELWVQIYSGDQISHEPRAVLAEELFGHLIAEEQLWPEGTDTEFYAVKLKNEYSVRKKDGGHFNIFAVLVERTNL